MEGLSCTHLAIVNDVPLQLWEAITTDGTGQTPLLMTRALHNKPLYFVINYARCYFHYLSPHFLSQTLGPFITIALIAGVIIIWKKGEKAWMLTKLFLLLYPLFFLFELQRWIK